MSRSTHTIFVLLFILLIAIYADNFLFKSKPLKYKVIFPFIYGYLFWGVLISSGFKFWLYSPTFYESTLVNAFAPGWIVFLLFYSTLAIKKKTKWIEIIATLAIAIPLMLFIQIFTGFIFTCAGYGDCL